MRYVVAVSGGVDSVVLLDILVHARFSLSSAEGTGASSWLQGERRFLEFTSKNPAEGLVPPDELIVAHFDHGIREDSADDATFVKKLAGEYGLVFETKREELGAQASEETARLRRYAFLRELCETYDAQLVTAHHQDDVVESVAINLHRGTGWRGLAVLAAKDIWRPLLAMTKVEILEYASAHGLAWREDSTNQDQRYLRNKLRARLGVTDADARRWIAELRDRQVQLAAQVDSEATHLVGSSPYSRYFLAHVHENVALELLRSVFVRETGSSPTLPQRRRVLHAIKVSRHGSVHDVGDGARLRFTTKTFVVVSTDKVLK